jgi:hypothetical protein
VYVTDYKTNKAFGRYLQVDAEKEREAIRVIRCATRKRAESERRDVEVSGLISGRGVGIGPTPGICEASLFLLRPLIERELFIFLAVLDNHFLSRL